MVDFGRRPYSTTIRPWKDSDREVKIRWFRCLTGAAEMPYPSPFLSRESELDEWPEAARGEVFDRPRPFKPSSPIPGVYGETVCGTEDEWTYGALYVEPLPVTEIGAHGERACCPVPGIEFGGSAQALFLRAGGGIAFGGTAEYWFTPSGGILYGGAAELAFLATHVPSGGVELGGAAELAFLATHVPYGGSEMGGEAEVVVTVPHVPSGGIEFGYTVYPQFGTAYATSGGVELGGAAAFATGTTFTPTGGPEFGGTAPVSITTPPSGLAGGGTCETAVAFPYNTPTVCAVGAGQTRWYKVTVAAFSQYRFKVTGASGTFAVKVYDGECLSLGEFGSWNGNGCANKFPFSNVVMRFRIVATTASTFTLTGEPGTCP